MIERHPTPKTELDDAVRVIKLLKDHGACRAWGLKLPPSSKVQALGEARMSHGDNIVELPVVGRAMEVAVALQATAEDVCRGCSVRRPCYDFTVSRGIKAPIQAVVDKDRELSVVDHPISTSSTADVIHVDFGGPG